MSATLAGTMPRQSTGSVETHEWRDGKTITYRARFRAYGRRWRIDFGTNHEGWNEERARVELERIMGQIARGTWEPPPAEAPVELDRDETLHVTASRWWQRRESELAENTKLDYRWRLDHVLLDLAHTATAAIDARRVDHFRQKLHARGLSPRSVNMALDLLAQVLDDAVEYGLLDANPARGRRRRMKVAKTRRTFLEPDQVIDLLDVAGEWESGLPPHQQYGRRALLAALCLAGPRISELTSAPRARLDLHGGRLRVGEAKTEAGMRDIELTFQLQAELREHVAHMARSGARRLQPRRSSRRTAAASTAPATSATACSPSALSARTRGAKPSARCCSPTRSRRTRCAGRSPASRSRPAVTRAG